MKYLKIESILYNIINKKFKMKYKNTLVDFVHTHFVCEGKTTTAICVCRLQFDKIGLNFTDFADVVKKRFPYISNNGVFKTIGKATLDDKDEFDSTLGEHIAETRAQQKAYKTAYYVFDDVYNLLNETLMGDLKMARRNCQKNYEHSIDHTDELIYQ